MDEKAGVDMDKLQTDYLWLSGAKMVAMALLVGVATVLVGLMASRVAASVGRDMRRNVYAKVMGFSNAEMDKFSTASLITRTTNDIQQVQFVTVMLLRVVAYAPILGVGGILKVMQSGANMEWIIALAVVVIMAVVALLMAVAMPKFKKMQELVDGVNLVSREILTGIPVIRAFGREKKEEERFDEANRALTSNTLFTNRVMTFMMPLMTFIMYGLNVLIIWVSAHRIDDGTLQVGEMTAFITYSMQIVMSFLMITMMSVMLPRAGVAANRIQEVLDEESQIADPVKPEKIDDKKGVVRFNHVHFRYENADSDVLDDIDFTAEPGKTTAIVGSTGCGKSTLVNLIPRLYDVTDGSVEVDGHDIRNVEMSELRSMIGFVPQKAVLFSGTIASNIKFGNDAATDAEMKSAAEIAQAVEFIDEKKDKYDSAIAQGGSNVSGGQKQRLSIARAIAKSPKIYVFDDSFSALDLKTDAALRKELAGKVSDATVIIVAQRISTVMNADQIIVLDDGRVVGKGTHGELMKNCQVYSEIAHSQLSARELGEEA
jgi:ATP-binding cassette subfamily B protein